MRLRHIEVIQAILETGSVTAAAQLLHISQPAVSKLLAHAEQQAGFPLFSRVRGRLEPTPQALALRAELSSLSDQLQRVRELSRNLQQPEQNPLRLVSTPALASSLLPRALPRWRRRFADTPCALATQHTEQIQRALLLREADLGLTLQPALHPALRSQCLGQAEVKVIAPPGHWPAGTTHITLSQLAGERLTGLDSRDPLGLRLNTLLEQLEPAPLIRTRVQTYQLLLSMVAAGEGLALVDPYTASLAEAQALQQASLQPAVSVGLHLWWLEGQPLSPAQRGIIEALRQAAAECLALNRQ